MTKHNCVNSESVYIEISINVAAWGYIHLCFTVARHRRMPPCRQASPSSDRHTVVFPYPTVLCHQRLPRPPNHRRRWSRGCSLHRNWHRSTFWPTSGKIHLLEQLLRMIHALVWKLLLLICCYYQFSDRSRQTSPLFGSFETSICCATIDSAFVCYVFVSCLFLADLLCVISNLLLCILRWFWSIDVLVQTIMRQSCVNCIRENFYFFRNLMSRSSLDSEGFADFSAFGNQQPSSQKLGG